MKKKINLSLILMLFVFVFGVNSVFASCPQGENEDDYSACQTADFDKLETDDLATAINNGQINAEKIAELSDDKFKELLTNNPDLASGKAYEEYKYRVTSDKELLNDPKLNDARNLYIKDTTGLNINVQGNFESLADTGDFTANGISMNMQDFLSPELGGIMAGTDLKIAEDGTISWTDLNGEQRSMTCKDKTSKCNLVSEPGGVDGGEPGTMSVTGGEMGLGFGGGSSAIVSKDSKFSVGEDGIINLIEGDMHLIVEDDSSLKVRDPTTGGYFFLYSNSYNFMDISVDSTEFSVSGFDIDKFDMAGGKIGVLKRGKLVINLDDKIESLQEGFDYQDLRSGLNLATSPYDDFNLQITGICNPENYKACFSLNKKNEFDQITTGIFSFNSKSQKDEWLLVNKLDNSPVSRLEVVRNYAKGDLNTAAGTLRYGPNFDSKDSVIWFDPEGIKLANFESLDLEMFSGEFVSDGTRQIDGYITNSASAGPVFSYRNVNDETREGILDEIESIVNKEYTGESKYNLIIDKGYVFTVMEVAERGETDSNYHEEIELDSSVNLGSKESGETFVGGIRVFTADGEVTTIYREGDKFIFESEKSKKIFEKGIRYELMVLRNSGDGNTQLSMFVPYDKVENIDGSTTWVKNTENLNFFGTLSALSYDSEITNPVVASADSAVAVADPNFNVLSASKSTKGDYYDSVTDSSQMKTVSKQRVLDDGSRLLLAADNTMYIVDNNGVKEIPVDYTIADDVMDKYFTEYDPTIEVSKLVPKTRELNTMPLNQFDQNHKSVGFGSASEGETQITTEEGVYSFKDSEIANYVYKEGQREEGPEYLIVDKDGSTQLLYQKSYDSNSWSLVGDSNNNEVKSKIAEIATDYKYLTEGAKLEYETVSDSDWMNRRILPISSKIITDSSPSFVPNVNIKNYASSSPQYAYISEIQGFYIYDPDYSLEGNPVRVINNNDGKVVKTITYGDYLKICSQAGVCNAISQSQMFS